MRVMLLLAVGTTFAFPQTAPAHSCFFEWEWPECDDGSPVNGYWAWNSVWVPGYITIDTWFTPAPIHFTGKVTHYGPGAMEATAAWRGMNLEEYVDGVALMSPGDVGERVWIKYEGIWKGPFLVVDCARRGDMWPVIMHRGEAVEVGYETAALWGLEPPYPEVEVAKDLPQSSMPVILSEWFQEHATFGKLGERILYRAPNSWRIGGEWIRFNDYHELQQDPTYATLSSNRRKHGR